MQNTIDTVEIDRFHEFWKNFRVFPFFWGNALIRRPAWLLLIFVITYGSYLTALFISAYPGIPYSDWTFVVKSRWWGKVVIGQAETHILFIAAFFVVWFLIRWAQSIPDIFEWLRRPTPRLSLEGGNFEDEYFLHLKNYQQQLNSKTISLISSLYLVFLGVLAITLFSTLKNIIINTIFDPTITTLILFALVWGYLLGMFFWPVIVTVRFIQALTRQYYVIIKPSHPDQCGGLKPLGDFCFNMSLPIIIGALATALVGIGGWILYFSGLGTEIYHDYFLNSYFSPIVAYFSIGILVLAVTPLLYITFFLSLKFVHEAMEARKRQAQDEFADQVSELESRIPELASRIASLEAARMELDQLEILRVAYPPKGYPSWPFRPSLAIALFSPQILGVISLLLTFWQIMKD